MTLRSPAGPLSALSEQINVTRLGPKVLKIKSIIYGTGAVAGAAAPGPDKAAISAVARAIIDKVGRRPRAARRTQTRWRAAGSSCWHHSVPVSGVCARATLWALLRSVRPLALVSIDCRR